MSIGHRSQRPPAHPMRVLIVEGNDDLRTVLADLCQVWGHGALVAGDGVQGVGMALDHVPDIAFIDVSLPNLIGFEIARRLRASPHCADVRLVALTAYASPAQRNLARDAGFRMYIEKSNLVEDISAIISAPWRHRSDPERA